MTGDGAPGALAAPPPAVDASATQPDALTEPPGQFVLTPQGDMRPLTPEERDYFAQTGIASLPSGLILAPEQAAEHLAQEKYGGAGGELAAAGLGFLRSTTLGLSDVPAASMLGQEYVKGVREANPGATGLGEGAGLIAPMLTGAGEAEGAIEGAAAGAEALGSGAGAEALGAAAPTLGGAAKGALQAATAPLRAAGSLREAITESLGGLHGAVLGSMAEGSLFGAGHAISENALGDPRDLGEALLIDGGLGAAIGGGFGALGYGLKEFAVPKALDAASSALDSARETYRGLMSNAIAAKTGISREQALEALSNMQAAIEPGALDAEKAAAKQARSDAQAQAASEFQSKAATLAENLQAAVAHAGDGMKTGFDGARQREIEALAGQWNPLTALPKLGDILANGIKTLGSLRAEPDLYSEGPARLLEKHLDGLVGRVADTAPKDSIAQALKDQWQALRVAENPSWARMQQFSNTLTELASRSPNKAGVAIYQALDESERAFQRNAFSKSISATDQAAMGLVRGGPLRDIGSFLKDAEAWGPIAQRTKAENDAIRMALSKLNGPGGLMRQMGYATTDEAGFDAREISADKVLTYLRALSVGKGGVRADALHEAMEALGKVFAEEKNAHDILGMAEKGVSKANREALANAVWEQAEKAGAVLPRPLGVAPAGTREFTQTARKLYDAVWQGHESAQAAGVALRELEAGRAMMYTPMQSAAGLGYQQIPLANEAEGLGPASQLDALKKLAGPGGGGLGMAGTGAIGFLAYRLGIPAPVLVPLMLGKSVARLFENPVRAAEGLSRLARSSAGIRSAIREGVGSMLERLSAPPASVGGIATIAALHEQKILSDIPAEESRSDAIQRHKEDLALLSANPQGTVGAINHSLRHVATVAPGVAASAAAAAHRALAVLSSKAPTVEAESRQGEYARAAGVLLRSPLSILDEAGSHALTPGQARAFQDAFPRTHAAIVGEAQRQLAETPRQLTPGGERVLRTLIEGGQPSAIPPPVMPPAPPEPQRVPVGAHLDIGKQTASRFSAQRGPG